MESIVSGFRGVNLTGKRFGRWTVVGFAGRGKLSEAIWSVECECGATRNLGAHVLKYGGSLSCGCLHRDAITTHGATGTTEFKIWDGIKTRCFCESAPGYKDYGGRGITMCERWRVSFENFLSDVGNRPSLNHSIDRYPNNDGNYEPGNVRWATRQEQQRNRRVNKRFTINGVTMCMAEWAEAYGIDYRVLKGRVRHGWGIEDALTRPVQKKKRA